MTDIETVQQLFLKIGMTAKIEQSFSSQIKYGTQYLEYKSKEGPTGDCGYHDFCGIFFFDKDGNLTEFGAYE